MDTHKELYLFAPENDMALAFGGKYYTPTPAAQGIARDLSLLPLWYAHGCNTWVWAQQCVEKPMQDILDALGITTQATLRPPHDTTHCHPWGWSAYITDRLIRNGISPQIVPNGQQIETIRTLSGRATTRTILQELHTLLPHYQLPPLPQILRTDTDVERYVTSQPTSMLKAPWSSSGRGVWQVNGAYDTATARSASGIIRKQGYIMGEEWKDKVCDLAMEFYSDGTTVQFAGYSLFTTDQRGAYQGNMLASNDKIEQMLSQYIATATLHEVRDALCSITTSLIAPHYRGYLGIDMIVYRHTDGTLLLHPCIELNLRMSMGMVARTIADRYIAPSAQGTYHVHYESDTAQLQELNNHLAAQHPLHIVNSKIQQGYLALTPIMPDTHYVAYIIVES